MFLQINLYFLLENSMFSFFASTVTDLVKDLVSVCISCSIADAQKLFVSFIRSMLYHVQIILFVRHFLRN